MKKRLARLIAALIVLGCVSRTAPAMWEDIPMDKLVAANPVVLIGKIEEISSATSVTDKFDTAFITVTEVLKNELKNQMIAKGNKIPLAMPAAKNIACSTDLRYPKGAEGVWILEYKDQMFWATYPKDYQPLTQRDPITQIIRKQRENPAK